MPPVKKAKSVKRKALSDKPKTVSKKSHSELVSGSKATVSTKKTTGGLSIPVYSLTGTAAGQLELPKDLFGATVNQTLLAQAIRVYTSNEKTRLGHTKTRGEVHGTTKKVWAQKGTGRARHGAMTAPIWVGGGIALGPRTRKVSLDLPKKMKQAALISALSQRAKEQAVVGLVGGEKADGKTKQLSQLLTKIGKKSVLIIGNGELVNLQRAAGNLPQVSFIKSSQLNTAEVIKHQTLLLTKEAVAQLESRIMKQELSEEK